MNIAHLAYHYLPLQGGEQVYIDRLARMLSSVGHGNTVFQRHRRGVAPSPGVVPVRVIPGIARLFGTWDYFQLCASVSALHRRALLANDVIIAHYGVMALPVWDHPEKVVVLSHGIEWREERLRFQDRLRKKIALAAHRRFTVVANDSNYLRAMGVDLAPGSGFFGRVAPRTWFIPNCIDTVLFAPGPPREELKDRLNVLVPRQINTDRGIDLAIRAFALVHERLPGHDMVIAGGPTGGRYFEMCRALAGDLGIAGKVRFVGSVPPADMPSYYRSADVTMIPSRAREGTVLAALESMACGAPVVSTAVGGLADLPTLQCAVDPGALARGLLTVIEARKDFARRQSETTRAIFSLENWRGAWLEVIGAMEPGGKV